jgi:hypothetical protein
MPPSPYPFPAPRPSQPPIDDFSVPTGPRLPQGYRYPNTGPLPQVPAPPSSLSAVSGIRATVLVAIGFLVVCAAMAAYVLWRGPAPLP